MEVTTIVNRKGGTGKTATAHALGAGLRRRGYKVLYIDLDSQCNLTYSLQAVRDAPSIMDVLTRRTDVRTAIQKTEQGDVLQASEELATADTILTDTGREYRLREALDEIAGQYDFVVTDTPAQLGVLTINALTASHNLIIPVQADVYSIQGIKQLHTSIESVKRYCNHDLYIRGILVTRYNGRAILSRDMWDNLEDVAKTLGTRLYKTPIRECIAVKEAQASCQDIFDYAPSSNASMDYKQFIDDFMDV